MLAMLATLTASAVIAGVPNPQRESPPARIEEHAVAVGAPAPNLTLESTSGGAWSLAHTLEAGPVILVFYRGDW